MNTNPLPGDLYYDKITQGFLLIIGQFMSPDVPVVLTVRLLWLNDFNSNTWPISNFRARGARFQLISRAAER